MNQIQMSFLAGSLWKVTLLLAAAGVLNIVLRRSSASLRHLVWTSALAGVLAVPLIAWMSPQWTIQVWRDLLPAPESPLFRVNAAPSAGPVAESRLGTSESEPSAGSPARGTTSWPLGLPFGILWLAGSLAAAAKLGLGRLAVMRFVRKAKPARAEVVTMAREISSELGLVPRVRLIETSCATTPMTWGMFRPVILIPAQAAAGDSQHLRTVLLHELAHVARRDYLHQMLGQAACALYWFHPLAWLAQREALRLRERASDDLVLRAGVRPSDYAAHLVHFARTLRAPRLCGSLAISRCSNLEHRVRAILDPGVRRAGLSRTIALTAALATAALVSGISSVDPALAEIPELPLQAAAVRTALPPGALSVSEVSGEQAPANPYQLESEAFAFDRDFEFEKAEGLYRRSLQVRKEQSGEASTEYAKGLEQLGALYRKWNRFTEAYECYSKALPILERNLGPNHPDLFEPVYFLALDAHSRGEAAKAETFYQRALELQRASGGYQAALALHGLALTAEGRGELDKAVKLLGQAQAILQANSSEKALVLNTTSRVLRKLGLDAESDAAATRSGEVQKAWTDEAAALQAATQGGPSEEPPAYRVGDGISAPSLVRKIEPQYSEEARLYKFQGTVVLQARVEPDGQIRSLRVLRPLGAGLDEQAVAAVRQWRFTPGMKDGQPVAVRATIEVNFRLL